MKNDRSRVDSIAGLPKRILPFALAVLCGLAAPVHAASEAASESAIADSAGRVTNPAPVPAASSTAGADAGKGLGDIFSLSGFGTLGASHSSLGTADTVNSAFQPNGTGHSRRYDFANTTMFGVQLAARFTDKLSAVVQVLAQQRYDNRFVPHVEWANVRYAVTPNFSVRVGRIEIPTFANSDFRNVGYANPWLHAPNEVYNSEPITNSDGADIAYSFAVGQAINTVRLMAGSTVFHAIPGPYRVQAHDVFGAFDTIEFGAFTGRIAYLQGNVVLQGIPAPYNWLRAKSTSLSIGYDPGKWFVQSEVARVTSDEVTPGYISAYISAGYRVGKFTPFVTYARSFSMERPTLTWNSNQGQHTFSAGVRWDVARNVDLKAQFDHVWMPANSTGALMNLQPTYQLGTGTNVLGVALDFVF